MTSWLARRKKQEILDLSSEAGLKQNDALKKDDLIDALDAYLQQEKTRLSSNSTFDPYYSTRRLTPAKPRASTSIAPDADDNTKDAATVVKSVVKQGGARPTKVKQEGPMYVHNQKVQKVQCAGHPTDTRSSEAAAASSPVQAIMKAASSTVTKVTETLSKTSESASSAVAKTTKTPARRKSVLPASPRDVADQVEEQSNRLYANLDSALSKTGIVEQVERTRDLLSSVSSVQLTFLGLEWYALAQEVLPMKYVADIPWIPILGMPDHIAFKLPNLFALLTGYFWSTTLLWLATSVVVPSVFGYLYNLTIRDIKKSTGRVAVARYSIDPLTFNVAKALATWLVYGRGVSFGLIHPDVALRVNNAMFGGYNSILLSAYVGILVSVYEAAQRK